MIDCPKCHICEEPDQYDEESKVKHMRELHAEIERLNKLNEILSHMDSLKLKVAKETYDEVVRLRAELEKVKSCDCHLCKGDKKENCPICNKLACTQEIAYGGQCTSCRDKNRDEVWNERIKKANKKAYRWIDDNTTTDREECLAIEAVNIMFNELLGGETQ